MVTLLLGVFLPFATMHCRACVGRHCLLRGGSPDRWSGRPPFEVTPHRKIVPALQGGQQLGIPIPIHGQVPSLTVSYRQSWALALYFQVRSPLISFPWIAIALALIWPIFRFAHRSIALRKTSGSLSEKSAKTQNCS